MKSTILSDLEKNAIGGALKAGKIAHKAGRLFYRVSDGAGCSCLGGKREHYLVPASESLGRPGKWAPNIDNAIVCARGYHATSDPLRWAGSRVAIVEVNNVVTQNEDKIVCNTMRELCVVRKSNSARVLTAAHRPLLGDFDLHGADLHGANLRGADMYGANLACANLAGADLRRAELAGADLYGADMYGARLAFADLYGADLRGAYLRGANLCGADLTGANLDCADLRGASLTRAGLRGANLRRADLRGANLCGADLTGANLDCDLRGANMRGACLDGVIGVGKLPK